ncbi:MAG TPA: histidine kinase [Chitinophagaceae bacterium]|nr:histidine kinase [Chitinophagaceae bacterium]
MSQHALFILLFVGHASFCTAQSLEQNNFRLYTTREGLSNNSVTGIAQDGDGYIWISTNHGLNRFDGTNFKQFLHSDKTNPIPDNAIFSIGMLPRDELAVATDDGAQIISTKTLQAKNLEIPTEDALRYWSHACRYVSTDENGNYGVSSKTGFYIFSHDGKLKKRYDRYTIKDIGQSWMMFGSHVYQMPDGNMMQENASGLYVYENKKNQFIEAQYRYPGFKSILSQILTRRDIFFFVSKFNIVFINTVSNSFDLVDLVTGSVKRFTISVNLLQEVGWQSKPTRVKENTWALNSKNKGFFLFEVDTIQQRILFSQRKYFSDYFCNIVFCDRQHRYWIGTTDGIFMQNSQPQSIKSFPVLTKTDTNFSITALHIDSTKIFAGTDKSEVLIIDRRTKQIIRNIDLGKEQGFPKVITRFFLNQPDTLWVSTSMGAHWINTRTFTTGLLFNKVLAQTFFLSKQNKVWFSGNEVNKIFIYDRATGGLDSIDNSANPLLNVNLASGFAEDGKGNMWIGGDAIARWNARERKIDTLITHLSTQKNMKKGFDVMNDSQGGIWAMVNDDGIAKIAGDNSVLHYRPENFQPDFRGNAVPTLISDKIYMATNNGVGFFNTKNGKTIVFNSYDGMPEGLITSYAFYNDIRDGSTWFSCKKRICEIPAYSALNYTNTPTLKISQISLINDTTINFPGEKIALRHDQNDISISLSAINFIDPDNMRFAYRIKNDRDSVWIDAGKQSNILLTNISPGNYELQFKVYAFDNKWPEQMKEIAIKIRPPFWNTWWFLTIVSLTLATVIFLFYKNRIAEVRTKARIDRQMAEYEIKALHAQMNPHFIFNCLNSIRQMILNNENQQASHYLSKFAHLIRITLNHSSKPFISLQNTIDYLKRYLEMEQIRKSNFSYQIHVDDSLQPGDIFLPPMLIQPFIENAIWHGASASNEPIDIHINFFLRNDQLVCVVDDNGIGIQASLKNKYNQEDVTHDHHSLGIDNVRQRIQVLNEKYNLDSKVTIEDKRSTAGDEACGTLVTLYLPVKISNI